MKLTLFLDSSALVKLYIEEEGQDSVSRAVEQASGVAVSTLALPEVSAAFFRKAKEGVITLAQARKAQLALREDWERLERFLLDDYVAEEAAILCRSLGLRGADAVQLATVAMLSRERRGVRFMAFDEPLNQVAGSVVRLWGER